MIRLNKVLMECCISLQTAVEFLKEKGYSNIDANLNAKITDEQHSILCDRFLKQSYQQVDHQFTSVFTKDFDNGFSVINDGYRSYFVNNEGERLYCVKDLFIDGYMIVSEVSIGFQLYGVINDSAKVIIPVKHDQIRRLQNGFFVAYRPEWCISSIIDPNSGQEIKGYIDEIRDVGKDFYVTYKEENGTAETNVYRKDSALLFSIPYKVYVYIKPGGCGIDFSLHNAHYSCASNGKILLTYWSNRGTCILKEVSSHYLCYNHVSRGEDYTIILSKEHLYGVIDFSGEIVIEPRYQSLEFLKDKDDLFIASLPSNSDDALRYGIVDVKNDVKVAFDYTHLSSINTTFLRFSKQRSFKYVGKFPDTFGIMTIEGKELVGPYIHSITPGHGEELIVSVLMSEYGRIKNGILNTEGVFLFQPIYSTIKYDIEHGCYKTEISAPDGLYSFYRNNDWCTTNVLSLDGYLLVNKADGTPVKISPSVVDWCGDFSPKGYAEVLKDGIRGHINLDQRVVSLVEGSYVEIPQKYDLALDFSFGFAPVLKKGKFGIIDTQMEEMLPCVFEQIEPLSETYFKFTKSSKWQQIKRWGLIDSKNRIIISADNEQIIAEKDNHFVVYNNRHCGLYNGNGEIVLPIVHDAISFACNNRPYTWIVKNSNKHGVYTESGTCIIPCIYDEIFYIDYNKIFICVNYKKNCYNNHVNYVNDYAYIQHKDSIRQVNTYTCDGEQIITIDEENTFVVPAQYDVANYIGQGLVSVMKDGKWGIINRQNEIILPLQYYYISDFKDSFAVVSTAKENLRKYFSYECNYDTGEKFGLIDTLGTIVLPIEEHGIKICKNQYIISKGTLYSPALKYVCGPYLVIKEFNDSYFLVQRKKSDPYRSGYELMDLHGNIIISDNYGIKGFQKIEIIGKTFFKVTWEEKYWGSKKLGNLGVYNILGTCIYENSECVDIKWLGNGLFCIEQYLYGEPNSFILINTQGKEIFEHSYDRIELQKDGTIGIQRGKLYGSADLTGMIIAYPKYLYSIRFNNGFANVQIQGHKETKKIGIDGRVVVYNLNGSEIRLPHEYYWGTDFKNDISIVHSCDSNGDNCLGIINEEGEVVIDAKYSGIWVYENKMVIVKSYKHYGLFTVDGRCVLPTIFKSIKHISHDRYYIQWSIKDVSDWSHGTYVPGNPRYKNIYKGLGRQAICNTEGEVLKNMELQNIGEIRNGYAIASIADARSKPTVSTRWYLFGVINIDGDFIVEPTYDRIEWDIFPFARISKNSQNGVMNVENQRFFLLDDITIINDSNSHGLYIYTVNRNGNEGVLNNEGVVVEPGIYKKIKLLNNGLILISDCSKYGLLNSSGKELLPMDYSYISDFIGNYASVRIGDKWGIIDSTGHFYKECIYDDEQVLPKVTIQPKEEKYKIPSVILHDIIYEDITHTRYNDDFYYNDDYEDDGFGGHGGYNGYDENTINEAFDGDSSLTWNID